MEAQKSRSEAFLARSGEQNVSQGNLIYVVPLDPAYKAGLAGHLPAGQKGKKALSFELILFLPGGLKMLEVDVIS